LKFPMFKKIFASPVLVRAIPFAAFAALTMFQGRLGSTSQYWLYGLKTVIGAWLLWLVRPYVKEMRWKFSMEAAAVGIAVFAAWVGLDGHYPMLAQRAENFNPARTYGSGNALALAFVVVRMIGSSLVVPPLEEVFYRSFLYRFLIKSDFLSVPLSRLDWRAFLFAGAIFGVSHYEWLPGILCAFAYQGLVIRTNRLGDAMTAHAVTNFLLGLWILTRHAYYFW
jgi:CAAX prenyl protease-like protein